MSWANKRRLMYLSVLFLIVFAILAYFFISIQKPPTCFDNKQNQNETGVDCGGSCQLLCINEQTPLSIIWTRTAKIQDGLYNLVAYVQNSNSNALAERVPYRFFLYDKDNVIIYQRENTDGVSILPKSKAAIFESGLNTGKALPVRAIFEFGKDFKWVKSIETPRSVVVSDKVLTGATSTPKLIVTLKNNTLETVSGLEVVAIIYDSEGTARQFSKTFVDEVPASGESLAPFTWLEPFSFVPEQIEVVLKKEK